MAGEGQKLRAAAGQHSGKPEDLHETGEHDKERTIMRSSAVLSVLIAFICVQICPAFCRPTRADSLRVVKVYNGAEAKLSDGRKIVYSGISVPGKKDKAFFQECREAHRRLVQDKPIIVLEQPRPQGQKLKRIPVVAFQGTLLINAELIRQGYALAGHSDDDFRYRDLFLELQRDAAQAGRGLWAYRDTFSEPYYVGSHARRIFHRPDCPRVKDILFKNRVILRTKDDALVQGYVQDWRCCPLFRIPRENAASP